MSRTNSQVTVFMLLPQPSKLGPMRARVQTKRENLHMCGGGTVQTRRENLRCYTHRDENSQSREYSILMNQFLYVRVRVRGRVSNQLGNP